MEQSGNAVFGIRRDAPAWRQLGSLPMTLLMCIGMAMSLLLSEDHDDQRLWQLGMFALLTPCLLWRGGLPGLLVAPEQRALRWSLGGFFLCGALSCLFAFSLRRAALEVSMLLMLLLLSIGVAREIARDSAAGVLLVLRICAAGCAAYAFKVVVLYLAALTNHMQPAIETFSPGFSNYRFLNHAQTVALPMLVLLCMLVKSKSSRYGVMALTAFWWALLFLTSGRGTMVGILAGCVVALVLRRQHAFAYCKMMALTACGGLLIYGLMFAALPMAMGLDPAGLFGDVARRTAVDPTSARLPLWARAIELISAHPFFGVGPMHYGHYAIDIQNGAHPHNWVLQIGAEWGIPALLCLSGAIWFAMRSLLRTAPLLAADDAENQHTLAAWIAIGAAIVVDGLVSGLIVMPMSQLWIALYLGCAAGWTLSFRHAGAGAAPRNARRSAGALLLLLASAVIVVGIAPDLAKRLRHEPMSAQEAALYNGINHPRVWLAGYF